MAASPASDASGPTPPKTIDVCGTSVDLREYTGRGRELVFDLATISLMTPACLAVCDYASPGAHGLDWLEPVGCLGFGCFEREAYEAAIFGATDTAFTVLSGFPYSLGMDGTGVTGLAASSNEYLVDVRAWVNQRLGAERVLLAPLVMPNDRIELQLAAMERWAGHAAAWHANTGWSPQAGGGFWLDDEVGLRWIEKGLQLDRSVFMVDKGMHVNSYSPTYTSPRDVGVVAAAYPAARFIVLHSAFEHGLQAGESSRPDRSEPTGDSDAGAVGSLDLGWGAGVGAWPEGPYDEVNREVQAMFPLDRGVNSLVTTLREHGIGPNQNVYASLDGVWAELMDRPVEAAHVLGKLLRYVGEDNVLWGTQSLWYGGPRPQLEAFRAFEIPLEMQREFGYSELTDERKAKILGLNAARVFCVLP